MADPFSVGAGVVGIADVLFRIGSNLKHIVDSSKHVDQDIRTLRRHVSFLDSTYRSIEQLKEEQSKKNSASPSFSSSGGSDSTDNLWRQVDTTLIECKITLIQLDGIIDDIVGYSERHGTWEAIKTVLRKEKRQENFNAKLEKVDKYQNTLSMLLAALNLQSSHNQLSGEVQSMRSTLEVTIARLGHSLVPSDDQFYKAINSAVKLFKRNQHFSIPKPVSDFYTGHRELLKELQAAFDVFHVSKEIPDKPKRFVAFGVGGSGKTQFCCKFADDNRDNFWGVFWVDASNPGNAESSFASINQRANIAASEGSNMRAAKDWLATQERWLLIIDNADNPSCPVDDYFPDSKLGCILITTRNPEYKKFGTVGKKSHHFGELPPDDASHLLLKHAYYTSPPWDPTTHGHAAKISKELGYLPVALIQAGTTVYQNLCLLADYIDYLRRAWQRIRKARYSLSAEAEEERDIINSSYEINLESLERSTKKSHIDAVQLLKMFSCFHYENIRLDVLIKAATNPKKEQEQQRKDMEDEVRLRAVSRKKTTIEYVAARVRDLVMFVLKDRSPPVLPDVLREAGSLTPKDLGDRLRLALTHLTKMSLIIRHEDGSSDSYSMHPLWHQWVRERPSMRLSEQALWCQAARTSLAQSISLSANENSAQDESMRRSLLPHINHVQRCQDDIQQRIQDSRETRPGSLSQTIKNSLTKSPTTVWPSEIKDRAKFSHIYMECSQWDKAEELQLTVLEYVRKRLGPSDPITIAASLFLSMTYVLNTRHNKAAELQEQALYLYEKTLGTRHPKTHKMMDTLGATRCFQGHFRDALALHKKAMQSMEANLKEVSSLMDTAIENLERLDPASLKKARSQYEQPLKTAAKNSLTKPEDLFEAWCNMGVILGRYFRYEEARTYYKKSALGMLIMLGPSASQTLNSMQALSMAYIDWEGNRSGGTPAILDDVLAIMQDVYDERRTKLGEQSPLTLLALGHIGRIHGARGEPERGAQIFEEIMPIAKRTLGLSHFGTLAGETHHANILAMQDKFEEAKRILKDARRKSNYQAAARADGHHPDHIMTLWTLVRLHERQGDFSVAVVYLEELEDALQTIGGEGLGREHPFALRVSEKKARLESMHDS
ncbi:hypothetical protein BS50DRAFT_635509 [Corynespora cassiicola Philippines]|uniref:Uncharacterized protein n=1 Tax=Corynespora cassiicola Philippines TaxID=1448308 RepID=A0A2T2NLX1_CORCC|nr:hypothetical protein BS50DRAFT_635509 [Corynespora cassiicola Philippines]